MIVCPPLTTTGARVRSTRSTARKTSKHCWMMRSKPCGSTPALGQAQVITSAGAYTNKPGQHGQGRALDIDGIFWSNKTSSLPCTPAGKARTATFYFGIERSCVSDFGVCAGLPNTTRPIGITFTSTTHRIWGLASNLVRRSFPSRECSTMFRARTWGRRRRWGDQTRRGCL